MRPPVSLCWTCCWWGLGAAQWQLRSAVMSQRYKSPHQARSSSEQSQRSQPGRLGWRDCCQEEKQNYTAPSACSFVFLGEAELVLDFLTTSPPIRRVCPAGDRPLGSPGTLEQPGKCCWTVRPWIQEVLVRLGELCSACVVVRRAQNSSDGSWAGGPWLFKGISSSDIRCSYATCCLSVRPRGCGYS